jgi:hypothetical protein
MKKFKSIFLLLFVFMLSPPSVWAQGFDGHWVGTLTVNNNGKDSKLPFEMFITTNGEGDCEGETLLFLSAGDLTHYARFTFYGTYNEGDDLEFIEYTLSESKSPNTPGFYWCEKKGNLHIKDKTLTGNVKGESSQGNCLPAKAFLTLKPGTK